MEKRKFKDVDDKRDKFFHNLEQRISQLVDMYTHSDDKELRVYEVEMKKYYRAQPTREKAEALYDRLMVYVAKKGDESVYPYLFTEIKILLEDGAVKRDFFQTFTQSRAEQSVLFSSSFGKEVRGIEKELAKAETNYKALERKLFTSGNKASGTNTVISSRIKALAHTIQTLRATLEEHTQNIPEKDCVAAKTDVLAQRHYEKLSSYRDQLDKGFVWLPSRLRIHEQTILALQNYRWPLLIGEAGSGKSEQADAAALELTGYLPVSVECGSTTGDAQLLGTTEIDPETGGSYKRYGALVAAYTGFESSTDKQPVFPNGRIVRFDEFGRLGERAYSLLKRARQLKAGDAFEGRKVLPGASAILTSNPVGPRYPDRKSPDPAIRREIAEVYVDYPEMSNEDPELYEYLLATLMDGNKYINVAKEELAPHYVRQEVAADDEGAQISKTERVTARFELSSSKVDNKHGILWRFSHAIKALQNSFIAGNATLKPEFLGRCLRYREVDGEIAISPDGVGEPLVLSTSTITLGELSSWLQSYNSRRERKDVSYKVDSLEKWLQLKINTYLKQADSIDKEKIEAIFTYFGCLNTDSTPKTTTSVTHLDIGYLSPRIPRPLEIENIEQKVAKPQKEKRDLSMYTAKNVLMENGESLHVRSVPMDAHTFEDGTKFTIVVGEKIEIDGVEYVFDGEVESADNEDYVGNGAVYFANGEKLYRVYESQDLMRGKMLYQTREFMEKIDAQVKNAKEFWSITCGNAEYIKYYNETTEPEPVWN